MAISITATERLGAYPLISITATERLGAYPISAGGREKVAKSIIHYLKTGEIQYPFIRIRPPGKWREFAI